MHDGHASINLPMITIMRELHNYTDHDDTFHQPPYTVEMCGTSATTVHCITQCVVHHVHHNMRLFACTTWTYNNTTHNCKIPKCSSRRCSTLSVYYRGTGARAPHGLPEGLAPLPGNVKKRPHCNLPM